LPKQTRAQTSASAVGHRRDPLDRVHLFRRWTRLSRSNQHCCLLITLLPINRSSNPCISITITHLAFKLWLGEIEAAPNQLIMLVRLLPLILNVALLGKCDLPILNYNHNCLGSAVCFIGPTNAPTIRSSSRERLTSHNARLIGCAFIYLH